MTAPNGERRPRPERRDHQDITYARQHTTTSIAGTLVRLRIDALELGRKLELDALRWDDACAAFRLAGDIASITRQVARW